MSEAAQRVVSLVPSLTETVCDLGVAGRLVGVSRYCVEPVEHLRFVPRVGGTKNPSLERIAGLDPDLILVNSEENRGEDIAWLKERFATFESMPKTVVQASDAVRDLGEILGLDSEAHVLLLEIEANLLRADVISTERGFVRVFYPIWKQPWIGVNRDTYISDVLTRAGAVNVCAERESRYPVVPQQAVEDLRPDLVLLPSEPFAFSDTHRRQLIQQQVFGKNVPVLMVDGKNFCWHGSRSGRGLGAVVDLLTPFRKKFVA